MSQYSFKTAINTVYFTLFKKKEIEGVRISSHIIHSKEEKKDCFYKEFVHFQLEKCFNDLGTLEMFFIYLFIVLNLHYTKIPKKQLLQL